MHQNVRSLGCLLTTHSWPIGLLKLAGALFGKADQVERLVGSLQVDSSKIRRDLGWVPPFSVHDELTATVKVNIL